MYELHFDCVSDCLAECEKAVRDGHIAKSIQRAGSDSYWIGREFKNFQAVKEGVLQHWKEGLDIVQEMIYEIERNSNELPRPKTRRRLPSYNYYDGDEINLDRLRSGQEFWRKTVRQQSHGPQFVTIITNICTVCTCKSEDILWRGAAAIVLTDILEKAGYRVRLMVCEYIHNTWNTRYDPNGFFSICLKEEQDPLDIANVVNCISGWFYRTVFFQIRHIRRISVPLNYGLVKSITENMEWVKRLVGNNATAIIIDNIWSKQKAVEFVKDTINRLNEGESQCL